MTMPKKALGATLVATLVALGAYTWSSRRPAPATHSPAPFVVAENEAGKAGDLTITEEAMKLAEIRNQSPTVRVVKEKLAVSGVVETGGEQVAKVTPRAPGKVVKLLARQGDRVVPGQTLAVLESAQLAQAQSEYRLALAEVRAQASNLRRQRELARLGQFGRPQWEESRGAAVASERDLREARHRLEEERAQQQRALAEREVQRTRWQRAQSLQELVSRQDQERIQADLKKAEADLTAAQVRIRGAGSDLALAEKRALITTQALSREAKVYSGQHLTSRELVEAESAARMAGVRLEGAADQVRLLGGVPGGGNQIQVVSPIRGEVQALKVTLGESLLTEQVVCTVVNLDQVWAQLAINAKDLPKIRVGNPVELTSDSNPGRVFQSKVEAISSQSDETTRAVYLRCPLKNPQGALKTQTYLRGYLTTDVRSERVTVPEGALQEHSGRPTLYVALAGPPGVFEVRHVQLGVRGDKWREISAGLKAGEPVAVSGTFYLKSQALKSSLSDGCCGGD